VRASMARGELSFSKVRALSRVATAENEDELLELAQGSTTAQLERLVRGWRRLSRKSEAELERERHESRFFAVFPDEEGMYVVKGRLDPEVAAALMRAVEAAGDALFRGESESRTEPAQRRADAVGLVAERALGAGFGREEGTPRAPGGGRIALPAHQWLSGRALPSVSSRGSRHPPDRRGARPIRAGGRCTRFT
jgi:hypothetical protein